MLERRQGWKRVTGKLSTFRPLFWLSVVNVRVVPFSTRMMTRNESRNFSMSTRTLTNFTGVGRARETEEGQSRLVGAVGGRCGTEYIRVGKDTRQTRTEKLRAG